MLKKRIELLLTINREIIRLFLAQQNHCKDNSISEPDFSIYASRLQSNLTYLATLADLSAQTRPHEILSRLQHLTPPDITPLPYVFTPIGQKLVSLYKEIRCLFYEEEIFSNNLDCIDIAQQQIVSYDAATYNDPLHVRPLPKGNINMLQPLNMMLHQQNSSNLWMIPYEMPYVGNDTSNANLFPIVDHPFLPFN
ncbi:hypothetical protein BDF20DRAFT_633517 [Mycotypha africana]|uniref:uncharacterized protein n=1 Tax=Mycotypha africana TaxID=64632 RepID=UPI002301C61A|nr:uncharacterized protein BDF20DRAFT_633517 [Mycotypha africana]KAI8973207.1 hypothetical protein BDF20DRAFT_633517 [Mycotypha africana]